MPSRLPLPAAVAVLLFAGAQGAAAAAPQSRDPTIDPPNAEPCFEVRQVIRYHGDGPQALIVRTDTDRYYRIGFAAPCPNVTRKDMSVTLASRGPSSQICRAEDLDLVAVASRFPQTCAVSSIQPMTADEVRALPARIRP